MMHRWIGITRAGMVAGLALGAAVAATPASGASLDTDGTRPWGCSNAQLTQATEIPNVKRSYRIEATCHATTGGVDVTNLKAHVSAVYEQYSHKALEHVTIDGYAGSISTVAQCEKDPFSQDNPGCTGKQHTNSTPFPILSVPVPLTQGLGKGATFEIASADGQQAPNPPYPKIVPLSILMPSSQQAFPVGSPVSFRVQALDPKWSYPIKRIDVAWEHKTSLGWMSRQITSFQPATAENAEMLEDGLNLSGNLFPEGHWRVRIRLAAPGYVWSDWRYFWIGQASMMEAAKKLSGALAQGGPDSQKAGGAGAGSQTPGGSQGVLRSQSIALAMPGLSIASVTPSPAPLQAGKPMKVGVEVQNRGSLKSGDAYQLVLRCKVLSGGGKCPVADATRRLPSIEPGAAHTAVFPGAAVAGKYELEARVEPRARDGGRTVELTVAPPILIKPAGQLKPLIK